jgi:hypothetical protein
MDGFEGFTDGGGRSALDPVYDYTGSTLEGEAGIFSPGRGEKAAFIDDGTGWVYTFPEAHWLYVSSPTSDITWVVGFAMRVVHNQYVVTELLQFHDSSDNGMFTVDIGPAGSMRFWRGKLGATGGTYIGEAAVNLPTNVWFYFECKVKFATSGGTVDVQINDEPVTVSLLNTQTIPAGVGTSPARVLFGASNSFMRREVDDLYICDSAGSQNNDFLGDGAIKRLKGNTNGTTNDFTGSPSGNNVENIDDDDPDGDTSYNYSGTSTDRDLYNVENCPSTPASIACASVVSYCKKTDSGSISPSHLVVSNGTDSSLEAITPAETYGHLYSFFPTDPDTSSAWTESGVNAMQVGVEIA